MFSCAFCLIITATADAAYLRQKNLSILGKMGGEGYSFTIYRLSCTIQTMLFKCKIGWRQYFLCLLMSFWASCCHITFIDNIKGNRCFCWLISLHLTHVYLKIFGLSSVQVVLLKPLSFLPLIFYLPLYNGCSFFLF